MDRPRYSRYSTKYGKCDAFGTGHYSPFYYFLSGDDEIFAFLANNSSITL